MTEALRVARVLHRTEAEGPGIRTAIWVQGCRIRCADCINPHLFSFAGGDPLDPTAIAAEAQAAGVEGITLLGGEPFDQAGSCADLAVAAGGLGLGVIVFTGYVYDDLVAAGPEPSRLLAATDLLVDGPYRRKKIERQRSLVGSTNQRFLHLTDRYRSFDPCIHPNRVDVRVSPSGEIELAGFLASDALDQLLQDGPRRARLHIPR